MAAAHALHRKDLHDIDSEDTEESETDEDSEEDSNDQKDLKKPCRYYNRGYCKRGKACTYRHICSFFLNGNCRNGSKCHLSHRPIEGGSPGTGVGSQSQSKTSASHQKLNESDSKDDFESDVDANGDKKDSHKQPCRFYNRGRCKNGKDCVFLHVCKYYLQQSCIYGSKCKLSHSDGGKSSSGRKRPPLRQKDTKMRDQRARPSSDSSKPRWEFRASGGTWCVFKHRKDTSVECSLSSDNIETEYQRNPKGGVKFTLNEQAYELDFESMTQTKLLTKHQRRIRRVPTRAGLEE